MEGTIGEGVLFIVLIHSNGVGVGLVDILLCVLSLCLGVVGVNEMVRCPINTDTFQWSRNWSRRYSIVGSVTLSWSRWSEQKGKVSYLLY